MVLEENQDLLNTQETGCSNDFPQPRTLLINHRPLNLPDKMISFSITCKELKLSCRYWHIEPNSLFYCLPHNVSALGLRLYVWVSPSWHGNNLSPLSSNLLFSTGSSLGIPTSSQTLGEGRTGQGSEGMG